MDKGILIVSFGTTYQKTGEKNIERIVQEVREQYPDCEVHQAYSSDKVRSILEKRDGIHIPDIAEALEQMKKNGVKRAAVLPTHIIDGYENHKMKEIISGYESEFNSISVAGALLEKESDYAIAAKALWDSVKTAAGEKIVIFMGHGSYHEADESYEKMERALREYSGCEIYIATVEGSIAIDDVIRRIKQERYSGRQKSNSVLITPFMLVAGEHANNDMAGEENSFLEKVRAAGFQAECLLRGIGEYEKIREIYLEHLKTADQG